MNNLHNYQSSLVLQLCLRKEIEEKHVKELQTLEANSKYLFILLCTIVLLFIEAQQGSIYIQYFPCALNSNCLFYHKYAMVTYYMCTGKNEESTQERSSGFGGKHVIPCA